MKNAGRHAETNVLVLQVLARADVRQNPALYGGWTHRLGNTYVLLGRYSLVNTLTGVTLVYITFALPFAVWTLRGFLIGIPKDLEEAAMVDGSTRIGAFLRILLPLVAPGLVATSVFAFITAFVSAHDDHTLLFSPASTFTSSPAPHVISMPS